MRFSGRGKENPRPEFLELVRPPESHLSIRRFRCELGKPLLGKEDLIGGGVTGGDQLA